MSGNMSILAELWKGGPGGITSTDHFGGVIHSEGSPLTDAIQLVPRMTEHT